MSKSGDNQGLNEVDSKSSKINWKNIKEHGCL
jgi:hypothetical protein